jgi:hypothetical protein
MQKRRWRPSLTDIVMRTCRKSMPHILANLRKHNALFDRLPNRNGE